MIKAKQCYEAPESELLVVRIEENFCQSPNTRPNDANGDDYDDEYDLGEI